MSVSGCEMGPINACFQSDEIRPVSQILFIPLTLHSVHYLPCGQTSCYSLHLFHQNFKEHHHITANPPTGVTNSIFLLTDPSPDNISEHLILSR